MRAPRIVSFLALLLVPPPPAVALEKCGALDSAMRARFDLLREQGRARDRDYDQQTGHGKTQDAVFR
ncbi:MAG: DUF922 domain-containing protein [Pseudomonadota bacterium]